MVTEQENNRGDPAQNTNNKKTLACWFRWWKNPTDRFSFLLVVVTFLLFVATVGLYCATRDLVGGAEDTARRQLRAYIGPEYESFMICCPECTGRTFPCDGLPPGNNVIYSIRNYGQTPAHRAVACGNFGPHTDKSAIPYRNSLFTDCTETLADSSIIPTIFPQEKRRTYAVIQRTDLMKDVISGVYPGYFFARIIYRDIFDAPHNTYLCRRYIPSPTGFIFEGCGTDQWHDD
jgi:hypothetical protein